MKILAVGIATLDIVNSVKEYPGEDDEVRALSQRRVRGGNATNTLTVLSRFGHQGYWAGVLPAGDPDVALVENSLLDAGINLEHVYYLQKGKLPTSYIILSQSSGSRSIVHFRNMPEYRAEWFVDISLEEFDWIHFEGRAVDEIAPMMQRARDVPGLGISLEVEKPREKIEELFGIPDLLLFAPPYARHVGCESAVRLLEKVSTELGKRCPQLVCSWGELGAWGFDRGGNTIHAPAVEVEVVDTIGAGDTFNAAIIDALVGGYSLETALAHGCLNAGRKCAQEGLEGFKPVDCNGKEISLSS